MKIKKTIIALIGSILLVAFTGYVLLDTFVITRVYASTVEAAETTASTAISSEAAESTSITSEAAETTTTTETAETTDSTETTETAETTESPETAKSTESPETTAATEAASSEPVVTDTSYTDENISITLSEYEVYGSMVYVADVQVSSPEYLQTAFAYDTYGKNVKAATSETAVQHDAVLAINGDYYGSRNSGYVLRNGVIYRDTASRNQEDLVIYNDGSFAVINESEVSLSELADAGAWQVLSFGPAIVTDGEVAVDEGDEVGKAKASNPRTAIGIIDELHYVFVVSDGRTDESEGLSLKQLGEVMQALGCTTAYNLDGGGSSTMYFNGQIINNPTTNGNSIKERSVSDIVYIG